MGANSNWNHKRSIHNAVMWTLSLYDVIGITRDLHIKLKSISNIAQPLHKEAVCDCSFLYIIAKKSVIMSEAFIVDVSIFCDDPKKIYTKSSYPKKYLFFWTPIPPPKKKKWNSKFWTPKMSWAYVCMKKSEYPPPPSRGVEPFLGWSLDTTTTEQLSCILASEFIKNGYK